MRYVDAGFREVDPGTQDLTGFDVYETDIPTLEAAEAFLSGAIATIPLEEMERGYMCVRRPPELVELERMAAAQPTAEERTDALMELAAMVADQEAALVELAQMIGGSDG